MCGSTCPRCGESDSPYGHPRGCALPRSTRDAIYYSGLPVDAAEAAITAAEDKALKTWGREYLAERRREDRVARAEKPTHDCGAHCWVVGGEAACSRLVVYAGVTGDDGKTWLAVPSWPGQPAGFIPAGGAIFAEPVPATMPGTVRRTP